ncbi:carboxy terminal-processing peptidase [Pseudaeromonas paramecii]|uniref:Carboxy terminal-processing peptidase n=1 Tax=Pseudaeromonas paramecii TaxID=2138166 RepID=A0ABP8PTJ2_9GAMM
MRQRLIRVSLLAAGLLSCGMTLAVTPTIEASKLPSLVQEEQHATASKRITALFTRSHYKRFELNDGFSSQIFDLYLESLDYNRNIFTQADIASFAPYRTRLDDALSSGELVGAYDIYNLNLKRRYERYAFALSLLDSPMTFDGNEEYQFDRSKEAWPKDQAELDRLWREKVKAEALSLKLSGKAWPEIKELLSKRYNNAIKRLTQSESEDVFQTLMTAFSRGIEPHTSYLSPRNADRFNSEMNLSLEGIGAVLQADDDFTVVRSLVPGGPADLSKQIKPEDKITGVGQEAGKMVDIVGWRLDDVVDLIKGPKGTKVRLEIQRGKGASNQTQIIELQRDKVRLEDRAAKSKVIEAEGKKIGVIEVPSFYVNLHLDVIKELDKLKAQGISALLIDLRGNGGGALTEATDLTGLFMTTGPVVQIRDAMGRISVNEDEDNQVYYDGPMTVLIDRYSASASEIFAAALKDYGRALILGENSFGKGTVQQHRALGKVYDFFDHPLGHVQYTIAKFYRINGGSTQNKGVVPDIAFPAIIDPKETGESVELNALPWDSIDPAGYQTLGDFSAWLPELQKRHDARVAKDPEFRYVDEDIRWYQEEKQKTRISLNEQVRLKERDAMDTRLLARTNERLQRLGKPAVKTLDDVPTEVEFPDGFLDEAANITADLVSLSHH